MPFPCPQKPVVLICSLLALFGVNLALAVFEDNVRPLLKEYCFRCHGEEKQKGDVQLSSFYDKRSILEEHKLWREVLHQIKSEEMPEEDPLPTASERALMVDWLEATLNEVDWSQVRNPGRVTIAKLTKTEYNNTMRDLLGIDIKPGNTFSDDGEGQSGFSNDRDNLFLTPALMEKYFDAADRAIDALLSFKRKPITLHLESEDMFMTETRETPKAFGDDFLGYVINRGQMTLYESVDFPFDGIYKFTVHALSTGGPTGARLRINDEIKGDIEVYDEAADIYEITAFVPKGSHQMAWNIQVPEVYYKPAEEDDVDANSRPQSVAIDWVKIDGPVRPRDAPIEPLVFIAQPDNGVSETKAADEIISHFAERAFRRPVSNEEVRTYLNLYKKASKGGDSFEESVKLALTAILVSPNFLYRPELTPSRSNQPYPLDDYQLASRMSYFLWASMPDDELFQLAKSRKLKDPKVLGKQVDRMLADPRAYTTMETFLGQWLGFESLGETVLPDQREFPDFNPALVRAMKDETIMVFWATLGDEGNLLNLLDSDETYLNEQLALHYGIDGVKGNDMRSVELPTDERGGLLGMGSVLTATSSPTRTNPVNRGKWVLETLLGNRIPEPPADAGILPENAGQKEGLTLRQEFEMHRRNPSCVDCHEKIDPIGFGLENFDAIGRYRTNENGVSVDSTGVMPDGVSFTGAAELKRYLLSERKDQFIRNATERMLAYALGRELKHYDEGPIRNIIESLEHSNYRTRTLVKEVVLSYPFQNQHPDPNHE